MAGLKQWLLGRRGAGMNADSSEPPRPNASLQRAQVLIEDGNRLEDGGDFAAALARYREAVGLASDWAQGHVNVGNALYLMGNIDGAIDAQRIAIRLDPNNVPARYNLGVALNRRGDAGGAENSLREALRLRPQMTDAAIVLADVLEASGRAKDAETELRQAIERAPRSPTAAHNLAQLLLKQERLDEAEDVIRRARSEDPTYAPLAADLASVYVKTGRAREAEPMFRAAIAMDGGTLETWSAYLFSLNCRDDLDAEQVFEEHRRLGALIDARGPAASAFANRPDPDRPLRIGYVSGDFRQHPVGLFIHPVLARHDRESFDIHCYANHAVDDDFTVRLKGLAGHWKPIAGLDDATVAERIKLDGIDVLIDLAGHTTNSRLGVLARRAAPVQVTWLGYLNTTGLLAMDYRLCDRFTDPESESDHLHTERLVRLPHSQWCYEPVYSIAPIEVPHPGDPGVLVLGSFNQVAKISDACLGLWASVLTKLDAARLRVFGVPEGRTAIALLDRMARCGIDPARVTLLGRSGILEYFAAIGNVDIALDAFPYNGATTTLDTLWMGIPIVGLQGNRGIARGTYSILSSLGASDLIATTPEDYVERNVALGRDEAWRRELRHSLRSRLESSPLMDATGFVKDLESSYRDMWRAWCARQAGQPIATVNPTTDASVDGPDHRHDFRKALALEPDQATAHYSLGNALRGQGKLDEAAASYRKAIALRPDFSGAHSNLGLVLEAQGRLKESVDSYDKAISSAPSNAIAHNNRGNALDKLGQFEAAVASFQRAIELDERPEFKANFVHCIRNRTFVRVDEGLRRLIARAISEPWAWKSALGKASTSVIKADSNIRECIARASRAWPVRLAAGELYGPSGLTAVANDPVLQALLENTPICDVDLERCLVMARRAMLDAVLSLDDKVPAQEVLSFYCALARQCFINEYVFDYDDEEWSRATSLRDKLMVALRSGSEVPPHWVAAFAAYFPLLSIAGVDALLDQSNPESVRALLAQQISEPLEERRDRDEMPRLTSVDLGVSIAVRQQYEENPYPRWVKLPPPDRVAPVDLYLRQQFPFAPFRPLGKEGDIDILVAGCGTGGESIRAAQQFAGARVLAIDLSLSSLCYAKRKTREIGLTTIEYAQADIMKLESIGRSFDVISCVGVLHHLADPAAGLHCLLSLLRPGGVMRLGLYSELARRAVVSARRFIGERGYVATADDIRRCRQDLIDMGAKFLPLTMSGDFYSMSDCRDLLFHVEEHRFTLPQLRGVLRGAGLEFIGFLVDSSVASAYSTRFPNDKSRTDLDLWHRFETEFPDTFAAMYDFWVQKPRAS